MKEYLLEIYDESKHDGIMFMEDDDGELQVNAFYYNNKEDAIETHELGYKYHLILYKEDDKGNVSDPEVFEAIIGNPWHYLANLIKLGFMGMICKKTETSAAFVNTAFDTLVS